MHFETGYRTSINSLIYRGFPGGSDGKESACNERPRFDPWVEKIPWRRAWQPTPVFSSDIPWTEEPSGLQSMESERAGED